MILTGQPPVEITLKRSARARRLSLRVSRLDGRVTMTLPKRLPLREAEEFAREKEAWLRQQLATQGPASVVAIGSKVAFRGHDLAIVPGTGRAPKVEGNQIRVPGAPETAAVRIKAFLKVQARDQLAVASDRYAAMLGVSYGRITLRDTRSRWGSCTHDGNLMYSWRLIMAPPEVLEYVTAHEVAHLVEMNHSAAFWAVVARVCPNYAAPRRWLRQNAGQLHSYRFGD